MLNWSDDEAPEDLSDALDHINLRRNRQFEHGVDAAHYVTTETVSPISLLPETAFRGKDRGWLTRFPTAEWHERMKEHFGRDISQILALSDGDGIPPVITIDGELGDGYGRTHLAHALGEEVMVARYSSDEEETDS